MPWLPWLVYPPVPQPENASASTAVHATPTSTTGLTPPSLRVAGGGVEL